VSPIPTEVHPIFIPDHSTILQKIKLGLPKYAPKLWTQIDQAPNQELSNLKKYMTKASSLLVNVSNASLNLQKWSMFLWAICTTLQVLWTGAGTVPGLQRDAHSGCTEGFGMLAAFSFLEQYLHHLPVPTMPSSLQIKGYCDNLGLIQQVTKMKDC